MRKLWILITALILVLALGAASAEGMIRNDEARQMVIYFTGNSDDAMLDSARLAAKAIQARWTGTEFLRTGVDNASSIDKVFASGGKAAALTDEQMNQITGYDAGPLTLWMVVPSRVKLADVKGKLYPQLDQITGKENVSVNLIVIGDAEMGDRTLLDYPAFAGNSERISLFLLRTDANAVQPIEDYNSLSRFISLLYGEPVQLPWTEGTDENGQPVVRFTLSQASQVMVLTCEKRTQSRFVVLDANGL